MNLRPVGSWSRHTVEITDPNGTRRIEVEGLLVVGREAGDLLVADATVSGRHLELDGTGSTLVVRDLGSSNGTFRGGERIDGPTELQIGDELRFGGARLVVVAPATAPPAPPSTPPPTPPSTPPSTPPPAPPPPLAAAPTPTAPSEPAGPTPVARRASTTESIRNDAVDVRFSPGTHGEQIASAYATAARRARATLRGLGSEPWGTIPVIHLIDPYHDGTELVATGSVLADDGAEAWVVTSPESPPEPPHRLLALLFGAALPSAADISLLLEGYGLHRSGVADPDPGLAEIPLPPLGRSEGELRGAMAVSFVRFLIAREGDDAFMRLLAAPAGHLDETVREVYGPSLGQLEQLWRRSLASAGSDVSTIDFLKLSVRYLRPYKFRQAEIFVYMLLSLAFVAAFPFVTQRLFDTALPSGEFSQVLTLLTILGVSFVISLVASVRQAYQTAWVSSAVTRDIRQTIFDRVQVMPSSWFAAHPQGDVLSRLFSDVGAVQSGLSQAIGQGVFQIISLVVSGIIMLSINLWLGLIVLAAAPLVAIVYRSMANGARDRSLAVQEQSSSLLSVAAENYRASPVVKMFDLSHRERRRFAQQGDRLFRSSLRLSLWGGFFGLSVNLIVTLLRLGVLGFGAWLILQGNFTVGGLVAFLSIMGEVLSPVTVLVSLSQEVQASMGSLVRINEVVEAATEPDDPHLPPVAPVEREIRFAGVGMSYDSGHRALDGIDVAIPVGARVAIVGPSGSGKSTVLRMLMRLHDPDEGAVLVDGIDITTRSLSSWRAQLGVVFQDSFLFDATIRENIALGRVGATDDEIRAAATAAGVDEFLDALPQGWDTLVGEGGGNLSGGQRQRVAIARALLRDPRVLLLDEATSALDPATERQINRTITEISAGRTVISVTHRLATVVDHDLVLVVDEGRLVEQGTHAELVARRGLYARLWAEQTGEPMPEPEPLDLPTALRRIPLLAGADESLLDRAIAELVPFEVEPGRVIEEGDGIMVVRSGHGELSSAGGRATITSGRLGPGDAFGVLAAMGAPATATLRAVEPLGLLHLSDAAIDRLGLRDASSDGRSAPPPSPPRSATRVGRVTLARPSRGAGDTADARRTMAVFAPPKVPT